MVYYTIAMVAAIFSLTRAQERSCTTLLINQPSTPSGTYTIDPDGPGLNSPFLVYCDMSSGVGVTVIDHDSESRTQVVGYNNIGSYRRVVNYTASIAQLSRLTEISLECEQFLKYECLHSRLRFYAWWVSRDGVSRTYWGGTGSNRGTNVCACGVNVSNTCADPSEKCNCNKNDAILRSDEGLLTWKQDLPVIELRFGDTQESSNEMGYHTLGKLKCSGLQDDCPGGQTCPRTSNAAAQSGSDDKLQCSPVCILIILAAICILLLIVCVLVIFRVRSISRKRRGPEASVGTDDPSPEPSASSVP